MSGSQSSSLSIPFASSAANFSIRRFVTGPGTSFRIVTSSIERMGRMPRLVLEIGTYSGYSALCLAEGLEQGAMLHTFEVNDEQEVFTRPWFENSPYADKITFHIGDALKEVPELGLQFDLAYIDADNMVMPFIRPGGFVLADNTLWDGHVIEQTPVRDAQTQGIMDFNDLVAADSNVEKVILPLRDGLTIIRKKNKIETTNN